MVSCFHMPEGVLLLVPKRASLSLSFQRLCLPMVSCFHMPEGVLLLVPKRASLSLSLLKSDLSRVDTVWLVQMSRPLQELISSKDRCLAQFLQKLHWKSGVAGQNIAGLDPLTSAPSHL